MLIILGVAVAIPLTCFKDGRIHSAVALLFWLSTTKYSILLNTNLLNYAASYFSNSFQ